MVRFVDGGDEPRTDIDDGLAPVTPLFGGRGDRSFPRTADEVRKVLDRHLPPRAAAEGATPRGSASAWRTGWDSDADDAREPEEDDWASVADEQHDSGRPHERPSQQRAPVDLSAARVGRAGDRTGSRAGGPPGGGAGEAGSASGSTPGAADVAERGLLKKLRARQLSVSEAKTYLSQHDLDADAILAIIDVFLARGYLDDGRLAEQVVHAGVDRKGQGRQAIAQSLAKRGVPRDVADAALAELPDDDAERALEFARTKASSMRGLERDVALRRLAGQLARRGYGGSAALTAARQALDELDRPSGRVRFEER